MKQHNNRLLKEYIKQIVLEYEYDGMGSYDSTGMGLGWGASQSDLFNTFVAPFTDVVKVAVGQAKEIVRRSRTLLRVAFEAVMTTIIPFVEDSYDEIFKEEKADIERIRNEYKDVYDRTLKSFSNLGAIGFFLTPGPFLLTKIASAGPSTVAKTLSVATGGLSDKYFSGKGPKDSGLFDSKKVSGTLLREKGKEEKIDFKTQLEKALKDPKIQAALKKNVEPIGEEIRKVKIQKLKSAYELAKNVLNAKNAKDIEKAIGKKASSDEIKKKLSSAKDLKNMKPEEIEKVMQQLPKGAMSFMKNTFVVPLETEMKELVSSNSDPEIIDMYKETISKIKAL
jgi:hypothetical protein